MIKVKRIEWFSLDRPESRKREDQGKSKTEYIQLLR